MSDNNLRNKAVKGVGWSAADAFLSQGITFLVGLILARLLSPAEYGLIGIVTIFISVLSGIVDSGFSNAIIRKTDANNEDYNTMFITNMVISILLYILLFVASPLIAFFFDRQELISLVRVMGLLIILQALSLTQYTILTKRIDFKTKTKASFISAIISGILGIISAFYGYGVWSLVVQQLSRQIIYTICLWTYNRWWPQFIFKYSSFKYLWGFGWKLLLSGLLNNVWNQAYQIVVGKFYNPVTLGHYTRAKHYAEFFSSNLTRVVQQVTFPTLSEIQNDETRMAVAYRKIIKLTMFITAICMISLAAVSEPLIICMIGPQWSEAASYLPLICIPLSLYPLQSINLNMLQVQGRSDIFLYLEIIKKIIVIVPICLGIYVGIRAMLYGLIGTSVISFFLNTYYSGKKLNYSSFAQLKDVLPSYLISITIAISIYFFKYLSVSLYLILIIQITVGSLLFFVICEIFKPEEYLELKGIAMPIINKIFKRQ